MNDELNLDKYQYLTEIPGRQPVHKFHVNRKNAWHAMSSASGYGYGLARAGKLYIRDHSSLSGWTLEFEYLPNFNCGICGVSVFEPRPNDTRRQFVRLINRDAPVHERRLAHLFCLHPEGSANPPIQVTSFVG